MPKRDSINFKMGDQVRLVLYLRRGSRAYLTGEVVEVDTQRPSPATGRKGSKSIVWHWIKWSDGSEGTVRDCNLTRAIAGEHVRTRDEGLVSKLVPESPTVRDAREYMYRAAIADEAGLKSSIVDEHRKRALQVIATLAIEALAERGHAELSTLRELLQAAVTT